MTRERFSLGAFWGNRRESADVCAERASACLSRLAACDETFSRWFEGALSRKQALERPIEPTPSVLKGLLEDGAHRTDIDRRVIGDLGFRFGLWNGREDGATASVGGCCGGYSDRVGNSFVVKLPERGPAADRVLRRETLICLIHAVVSSWEPDWLRVISDIHLDVLESDAQPEVGWLLYLPSSRGPVPQLPPPARVEPIEGYGNLIIVADERFSAERPEHLEQAKRVGEILAAAGLLAPISGPQPAAR